MSHHPIKGITSDSRQVKPGYAFVAIPGEKRDGHLYIKEAISQGARLIIGEKKMKGLKVPLIQVEDTRETLSQMAARFFQHPSKRLKVIGITGTNGKSTTTSLLQHILGEKAGSISTIGSTIGRKRYPPDLTTPDPVKIHTLLSVMVENSCSYGILEVSSHGIHQKRIEHVDFHLLIHTNLSADHLDYHQNFSQYLATKRSLFEKNPGAIALFNVDDPYFSHLTTTLKNTLYSYGIREEADLMAKNIKEEKGKTSFTLQKEKEEFQVYLPLPGRHNIYNALAAIGASLLLGFEAEYICQKIKTFPGIWRRMETLKENGFTVIDDCAHNPKSYSSLFAALERERNLYLINAIRGNRGSWINQENAKTIGEWWPKESSSLFISNALDLASENDLVKKEEEEAFLGTLSNYVSSFTFTQTFDEALERVLPKIEKGDILLLTGAHAFDGAREALFEKGVK